MNDTEMSLHKIPPHNLEAEAAILGGVLLENKTLNECLSIVELDDFYSERNRIIFRALCLIADSGKPIDPVILSNFLRERGEMEKIGGASHIGELLDNTVSSANIEHYCTIVKSKSALRKLIAAMSTTLDAAYATNGEDPGVILDNAQRSLMEISIDRKKNDLRGSREICKRTIKVIEERHEKKNLVTGLSTGFRDLDNWTSGLQESELVIIAGRPGMGKTALGVNIAENAVLSGVPAAVYSLEMSGETVMTRILSSQTGIDSRRLRRGFISDSDWPRLIQVVDRVSKTPLFIDDSSILTPMQLKSRARRLKIEKGLGLVIVDYLQLMTIAGRHETREREISEISRSLKALAKELNIPVVALSQLNRQAENRPSRRPGLADLRESGAIEQDADVIIFLYRDEIYNEHSDKKGIAELHIAKQRNGPTGKLEMQFDETCTRFHDLARAHDQADPGRERDNGKTPNRTRADLE
jgi:replicative DNA helicase